MTISMHYLYEADLMNNICMLSFMNAYLRQHSWQLLLRDHPSKAPSEIWFFCSAVYCGA